MLCTTPEHARDICTNRCEMRQDCTIQKIPLIIETLDILASEINPGQSGDIFTASIGSYCIAPEAYLNGVLND